MSGPSPSHFRIFKSINIIQFECWPCSPAIVYGLIFTRFCVKVGLWTKGAEKYPNFGYIDNRCPGNQKTFTRPIQYQKGNVFLKRKVLGGLCKGGGVPSSRLPLKLDPFLPAPELFS